MFYLLSGSRNDELASKLVYETPKQPFSSSSCTESSHSKKILSNEDKRDERTIVEESSITKEIKPNLINSSSYISATDSNSSCSLNTTNSSILNFSLRDIDNRNFLQTSSSESKIHAHLKSLNLEEKNCTKEESNSISYIAA